MERWLPEFAGIVKSAVTGVITRDEFAFRLERLQEIMFNDMSCQDTRVRYETHLVPVLRIELQFNREVNPIPVDFNTVFKHLATRRLNNRHFGVIADTLINRYTLFIEVHNVEFAFPVVLPSPLPVSQDAVGIQAGTKRKAQLSPSSQEKACKLTLPPLSPLSHGNVCELTPSQQATLDERARRDVARAETNSRLAVAQEMFRASQAAKALAELLKTKKSGL
jgi:hypothetical protein